MAARRDSGGDEAGERDRLDSTVASIEAYFRAASAILAMRATSTEVDISAALLKRHYGVAGSLATLSSEIERTVAVDLSDRRRLILKTSTRPEAVSGFRFQSEAIAGLRGAPGFVVPDVLRTNTGALMFEDEGICGYLQTRLDGIALYQATPTTDLLFRTGCALAQLDVALNRISLPATDRPILWHIGCWPRLMEYAQYLPSGPIAEHVGIAMRDYEIGRAHV